MPKILDRTVSQLKAKGIPESRAYAIATSTHQKAGNMKGGKATAKGKRRGDMTSSQRAKCRASKKSGKSKSSYTYSSKTNQATLRASSKRNR